MTKKQQHQPTLVRGKMSFARDLKFENNILNASAEGASAIFIGIFLKKRLCGYPNIVIRTSAGVYTNETRADETLAS